MRWCGGARKTVSRTLCFTPPHLCTLASFFTPSVYWQFIFFCRCKKIKWCGGASHFLFFDERDAPDTAKYFIPAVHPGGVPNPRNHTQLLYTCFTPLHLLTSQLSFRFANFCTVGASSVSCTSLFRCNPFGVSGASHYISSVPHEKR